MKKILLIVLVVVVIWAFWCIGQYNSFVSGRAGVDNAWANIETQYQRRSDLIPQIVATVQGAANFEKSTLMGVVEARAKATSITVDPTDAESMSQFDASQAQLSGALSRLLVSVEAYPELKANQNFRDLQSQLEWTENRIAVVRSDYNDVVTSWNVTVTRFPQVFMARLFWFQKAVLFDAQPGSEVAPKIEFNIQ